VRLQGCAAALQSDAQAGCVVTGVGGSLHVCCCIAAVKLLQGGTAAAQTAQHLRGGLPRILAVVYHCHCLCMSVCAFLARLHCACAWVATVPCRCMAYYVCVQGMQFALHIFEMLSRSAAKISPIRHIYLHMGRCAFVRNTDDRSVCYVQLCSHAVLWHVVRWGNHQTSKARCA
jgi:hypothetical protein